MPDDPTPEEIANLLGEKSPFGTGLASAPQDEFGTDLASGLQDEFGTDLASLEPDDRLPAPVPAKIPEGGRLFERPLPSLRQIERAKLAALEADDKRQKGPGRPRMHFTDEQRWLVEAWARVGTRHDLIAHELGVSMPTLLKYFGDVLHEAKERGVAQMGATLYAKGLMGDTASAIFYLKARGGWRENQPGTAEEPLHIKGDIDVTAMARAMREMVTARGQQVIEQEDKDDERN